MTSRLMAPARVSTEHKRCELEYPRAEWLPSGLSRQEFPMMGRTHPEPKPPAPIRHNIEVTKEERMPLRSLSLFLTTAALLAAQPSARVQTGYDTIQPTRLKADLTFLSSDLLEGRLSLQRGSEIAIQWIASEFAKAGLKPLSGDSYLQPVPLIEFSPDRALTSLTLTRDGHSEVFHAPDATATFAHEVTISGRVVFAGFGITAPELNYDDYAGIDARGKIVLIFNHEPQEADPKSVFNGIGNTRYANNNYKLFNAERHGAVAVLTMPDPNHQGPVRGGGRTAAPVGQTPTGDVAGAVRGRPRSGRAFCRSRSPKAARRFRYSTLAAASPTLCLSPLERSRRKSRLPSMLSLRPLRSTCPG